MKFCSECGTKLTSEDLKFCPNCGNNLQAKENETSKYYSYSETDEYSYNEYDDEYSYPMKWYKFLIYFGLFASAVLNIYNAYNYLTGNVWNIDSLRLTSERVYEMVDGLKFADIIFGSGSAILAIIAIITRKKLANFEMDAPSWVTWLYGGAALLNAVYSLILMAILPNQISVNPFVMIVSIIFSLGMIGCNKQYFNNRCDLFVN